MPSAAQPRSQGSRILPPTVRQLRLAQERRGRVGAHAAGVQAEVAVQRALVVLGGREQLRRLAVAERVQGDLHPFKQFLDDDAWRPRPRRPS